MQLNVPRDVQISTQVFKIPAFPKEERKRLAVKSAYSRVALKTYICKSSEPIIHRLRQPNDLAMPLMHS